MLCCHRAGFLPKAPGTITWKQVPWLRRGDICEQQAGGRIKTQGKMPPKATFSEPGEYVLYVAINELFVRGGRRRISVLLE